MEALIDNDASTSTQSNLDFGFENPSDFAEVESLMCGP